MALHGDAKREYQRKWVADRRSAWIASKGGRCANCGSTERLEIDHVDPTTKSVPVASLWSRTEAVREAELAKCQVLCETCHQEKTDEQFDKGWPHGTVGRYRHRKRPCRCVECRAAMAAQTREYRKTYVRKTHRGSIR